MPVIVCRDSTRVAAFNVEKFALVGVRISATLPNESTVVETMIDTPIDPDLLSAASSISEALGAIAINASNFCCAHLSSVYSDAAGNPPKEIASTTLISVSRPGDLPVSAFTGGPACFGEAPPLPADESAVAQGLESLSVT